MTVYVVYDKKNLHFFVMNMTFTAVFCPFTHTQTRASLTREWLKDEWSGVNGSVSGVQHWYSLPSLSLSSLE